MTWPKATDTDSGDLDGSAGTAIEPLHAHTEATLTKRQSAQQRLLPAHINNQLSPKPADLIAKRQRQSARQKARREAGRNVGDEDNSSFAGSGSSTSSAS